MRQIDQFAYCNRIRKLNPAIKAGFSLVSLLVCLLANSLPVSTAILALSLLASIAWARLPARSVLKLVFVEAAFLIAGVLGVAISISGIRSEGAIGVAGLWLLITPTSVLLASHLFLRALACSSSLNFLAMTTPMTDLIVLGKKLRIPDLLIDLMTLAYRSIFTLWDCFERMVTAREARLGFKDIKSSFRSLGEIIAGVFIESYRRSQKLELALEGREWEGSLRVLDEEYEPLQIPWLKKASSCKNRAQK